MASENLSTAKNICITALSMALICIATMFIRVPIPLGYAHLGNTFILITAYYFGRKIGGISAAFGSALADLLTGFSIWIIPTLIIKSIMGYMIGKMSRKEGNMVKMISLRVALAAILSNVWMVIGYTVSGSVLYGSIAAGLASTPGLLFEGAVNIVVFYVLGILLEKSKVSTIINR